MAFNLINDDQYNVYINYTAGTASHFFLFPNIYEPFQVSRRGYGWQVKKLLFSISCLVE